MTSSTPREGTPKEGAARRGVPRGLAIFAIVLVLLFGGLTAGWFYLAGELDRRVASAIEAAGGRGTAIDCADRDVFGYPFRLGIACRSIAVDAPAEGLSASGGALRTAAQVYRPNRIVAEFDGPVRVQSASLPPLEMNWQLAQASTTLWSEGLDRLSLALDAPTLAVASPAGETQELARSERLEIHLRRNASDLDLAFVDLAVQATLPGRPALPPFDASADLTVAGAADWLRSGLPGGGLGPALRGRDGAIRAVDITLASGGRATLSGPFAVSAEGLISGDFRLAIADPQAVANLVGSLIPGAARFSSAIAGAIGLAGRRGEDGRTVIEVEVREGSARLGFIPLGDLPRL